MKSEEVVNALKKRAIGYETQEVTEEYVSGDDGVKLVKRKVVIKPVPPDVTAVKLLMDIQDSDSVSAMTDEELELEKQRLISQIIRSKNDNNKNQ